jgi:DNA-binding LytR/AlgR family response regulator
MNHPTALIAEDEPLLAQALQAELALAWPALHILRTVGDGTSAVAAALALQPDVLFFDIRMPGQSGLEAAAELADAWPTDDPNAKAFPALVFVTAYDQYALEAFEAQAVDYLLKPVQRERLQKTISKLQLTLNKAAPTTPPNSPTNDALETTLAQLRGLLAHTATAGVAPLQVLQASIGNSIHIIPVGDVLYLEAADKYLRVLTATQEYLLRTPLKELLPQLDATLFWQTHRGTVVRVHAIRSVIRDEAGRLSLTLHHRTEKLPVSRLYAHRFKAM